MKEIGSMEDNMKVNYQNEMGFCTTGKFSVGGEMEGTFNAKCRERFRQ